MYESLLAPRLENVVYPWKGLIAQAGEAKGSSINGTLGVFLDDDLNIGILPAVADRVSLDRSKITAYAPSHGVAKLRSAWKQRLVELKHLSETSESSCSLPVVTQGITSALTLAGRLFLQPGESELIVPAPFWPNYRLIFEKILGTRLRTYEIFADNFKPESSRLNLAGLKQALEDSHAQLPMSRPLVLLLNLPHNPTGYTYTAAETTELCNTLSQFLNAHTERSLVVMIDDAYLGFNYEAECLPHSLLNPLAQLHERLFCAHLSGATKEVYAWGLRVGFLTFAAKSLTDTDKTFFEDKTAALIRGTLSNVSMLSQQLTLEALEDPRTAETHRSYFETLKRRYDLCRDELRRPEIARFFDVIPFNSGYFFTLRIKDPQIDAHELRRTLLKDHSVGVVALDNALVRVAFSSIPSGQIPTLMAALRESCAKLSQAA